MSLGCALCCGSVTLRPLHSLPGVTRLGGRHGRRGDRPRRRRWCKGGCGDEGVAVSVQRGGPEGEGGRGADSDKAQARRDGCGRSHEGDCERCGESAPRSDEQRRRRSSGVWETEREQLDRGQEGRRRDLLCAGAARCASCALNRVVRLAARWREYLKARIELAAAHGAFRHAPGIPTVPDEQAILSTRRLSGCVLLVAPGGGSSLPWCGVVGGGPPLPLSSV
jgi:hypothetical protein